MPLKTCPPLGLILVILAAGAAAVHPMQGAQGSSAARDPAKSVPGEQALFEELPVVEAAALHTQSLEEAPANVTVITAADIRKYGYRTLGEALAGVRGFDLTYDRIYHYVGVHGFSLPGDYNTRFLVMLNGHPLTENIYSSNNFFGQDFGLDMFLVQRIEIIRGPTSALYGSNGIFATVNVVTKSPVDQTGVRTSTETDSLGERKVLVSGSMNLGKGANLLLAGSFFNNGGQTLYFPEFDAPETNHGVADRLDGERGYHSFANLIWRNWDFIAYLNSREKQPPVSWDIYTLFNHRGARVRDQRNFFRAARTGDIGATGKLRWEISYDQYRYDDRFDYAVEDGVQDFRNIGRGDWVRSQLTYSFSVPRIGRLTAGMQATVDLRNLQRNFAVSPVYYEQLRISRPDRLYAGFAQQEWDLSRRWKAYLGLRVDVSRNFNNSVSPRLALVYQRSPQTVYKFVYGRPFRNPSMYEKYYDDGGLSFLPSKGLRPETANTFEISAERKIRRDLTAVINVYHYDIDNLIQANLVTENLQQFQNSAGSRSDGVELELAGQPSRWLETTASFAWQRAVNEATGWLPNSPRRLGKLRFAAPLARQKLYLSSSMQYLSPRNTRGGDSLPPVFLADVTVTTNRLLHPQFDVQFGIRNLFDRRYSDPVALAVDGMRQDGRSVFVKLIWRALE
ncbi:MAG: TonB-dependent receptor [Acidobacteria bacterium]|nr:TonB-dependent receptor [Acidobacteriota bacterium]